MADDKRTGSPDEPDDAVPENSDSDKYVDDPSTPGIDEAELDRATDEVNDLGMDEEEVPASSAKSTTTKKRERATARPKRRADSESDDGLAKLDMTNLEPDADPPRVGPITFIKQSIAELKKVRWANPDEVFQYFVVVLVFVVFIVAFVSLLDLAFSAGIFRLFG